MAEEQNQIEDVESDDVKNREGEGVSAETRQLEQVVNAFFYYKKYGTEKVVRMLNNVIKLPIDHQVLVGGKFKEHMEALKLRIEHNHSILKMMVNYGAEAFDASALRIHQLRRPGAEMESKVLSTLRQICREWSSEGRPERDATHGPIIEQLDVFFPDRETRHDVKILVPGCGLGRLAHDLLGEGYTVIGNEFSFFMLLPSCFIINACKEVDQFTIYPFVFDKSNSWDYEDQLRGVTFPDTNPSTCSSDSSDGVRKNAFSIGAGDFLTVVEGRQLNAIVTSWFIDTANNVMEYIDAIFDGLVPGGVWINVGPLTWHYEDVRDEVSIELPYSEVIRLVKKKGFSVEKEERIESKYTVNRRSMLWNQFNCAFFVAKKPL